MKSILLFGALAFFAVACSRMYSENVNSNSSLGNNGNRAAVNESFKLAAPSPQPIVERQPVNEADYTVSKFDYAKMRATTLGTQPLEIIKTIAAFDPESLMQSNPDASIEKELKVFDKYKIKTAEYDFNHDGSAERIVLSRGETGGEVELFSVFIRRNDQWHSVFSIEGNPDKPKVPQIEILTGANKINFDLIKTTVVTGDDSRNIRYYRMQNEQYQAIECYFIEGKTK